MNNMIFSELYSVYYQVVAKILTIALEHPLQKQELRQIIEEQAFGESILNMEPALTKGKWQLLKQDGTTVLHRPPSMPLTWIQKRWLKAISLDPKLRLFSDDSLNLGDTDPLFTAEDYEIFDQYADGDPYEDESYIRNFRCILEAIKNKEPLSIDTKNHVGGFTHMEVMPEYMEYSEKDDKIRLIGSSNRYKVTLNLARIQKCEKYTKPYRADTKKASMPKSRCVVFELYDERNALERVLLHFAHFEKQAEKLEDGYYKIRVWYDKEDETEMVIRILSFGPMIKVVEPSHFIYLIKERLKMQKNCGY